MLQCCRGAPNINNIVHIQRRTTTEPGRQAYNRVTRQLQYKSTEEGDGHAEVVQRQLSLY
jgi:hypothetical protein